MVSGWDKNPGPDNHYASPQLTKWQAAKLVTMAFIFYGVIVGLEGVLNGRTAYALSMICQCIRTSTVNRYICWHI